MVRTIKTLLISNTPLKICSFILGYALWSIMSGSHTITQELVVPLCWYDIPHTLDLEAPETMVITLTGTKKQLLSLNTHELAIHINAHDMIPGKNYIAITRENLFLPESIKLVHYSPVPVIITTTIKK